MLLIRFELSTGARHGYKNISRTLNFSNICFDLDNAN